MNVYDLFRNCSGSGLPLKKYLSKLSSVHDLDLFSLNVNPNMNSDYLGLNQQIISQYYSPYSFSRFKNKLSWSIIDTDFSLLHNIVRSLKINLENLQVHLEELNFHFRIMETSTNNANFIGFNPEIPNYRFGFVPTP